jgi:hypothetical protein
MSSKSICEYVECSALVSNECRAFHDLNHCPISKLGYIRDNQVFQNTHAFEEMKDIYKCVYLNLVEPLLNKQKYLDSIFSSLCNELSNEDQIDLGKRLLGEEA